MQLRSNIGFTLLEIIILVAIIAMLSAIAMPNLVRARQEADESKIKAELRTIYTGVSLYLLDESKYPKTWEDLALYLPIEKFIDKYEINPNL